MHTRNLSTLPSYATPKAQMNNISGLSAQRPQQAGPQRSPRCSEAAPQTRRTPRRRLARPGAGPRGRAPGPGTHRASCSGYASRARLFCLRMPQQRDGGDRAVPPRRQPGRCSLQPAKRQEGPAQQGRAPPPGTGSESRLILVKAAPRSAVPPDSAYLTAQRPQPRLRRPPQPTPLDSSPPGCSQPRHDAVPRPPSRPQTLT
ncbi:basic proline-rich protein-like [Pogoniulus pusillus]|uniref:basic proline-rich protein-like n=1 Tax=Pogoniulus pusillus TaxID=488313 RepID=UPI0030B94344